MKILIDECLPRKLKNSLPNHVVSTVPQMGWAGKKNGQLLALMQDEFDVFITVDAGFEYQQQLRDYNIGFILLSAVNNKLETLLPLMPKVEAMRDDISSGDVITISDD